VNANFGHSLMPDDNNDTRNQKLNHHLNLMPMLQD